MFWAEASFALKLEEDEAKRGQLSCWLIEISSMAAKVELRHTGNSIQQNLIREGAAMVVHNRQKVRQGLNFVKEK